MAFVSETFHMRRLAESAVNIETTYVADGKLLYRNTVGTKQDDVCHGIRCHKEYYLQGKKVHVEKLFDSRMEYTYVSGIDDQAPHTCANCGFTASLKEFTKGCPCCDAASNLDYADKELGGKHHYDLVLKKPLYRGITALVDYGCSLVLSGLFVVTGSRTMNGYDVAKIFLYGTILAMLLYYFFYLCDAYVVLGPIKSYKNRQNCRQMEFWIRTGFDKKRFFNNLNYEAGKRYYSRPGIIDYDVMDYSGFREYRKAGVTYVDVSLEVRLVYLRNKKIGSRYCKDHFMLRRNERILEPEPGIHVIKCPNCNANLDLTREVCEYCGTKIDPLQEWSAIDAF